MHKSRDGRNPGVLRFVAATDFSQHALCAAQRAAGERTRVGHKVGYGYAPHLILKQEQLRHVLADSRSDVLVVPA